MRPRRLELEGFTSFRDRTVIDLADADYFVLVGPTGSGKSTVIDAMCFALYGSVPRYDDRRLVAPVITQGQLEAKVRFDFSVGGAEYSAVRVVRRQGKGATTKEARLERDGEVLAGTADELSAAVVSLLGLTFDHFTKCVVLPQGDFARFLHDKPSERQGMLVELLNLSVYEVMGQNARARAARAKSSIELNQRRLEEDLAFATKEALSTARARAKRLRALKKQVDESAPELSRLESAIAEGERAIAGRRAALDVLGQIEVPAAMARFADEMAHARKLVEETEAGVTQAKATVKGAAERLALLPSPGPLSEAMAAHVRRAELQVKLDHASAALKPLGAARDRADQALARAEERVRGARSTYEAATAQNLAQHLAGALAVGEPCPVCLQPVGALPEHPHAPALEEAAAEGAAAEADLATARTATRRAATEAARAEEREAALRADVVELDGNLASGPERAEIEQRLAEIEQAREAAAHARSALDRAYEMAEEAQRALAGLVAQETAARRNFDEQRDRVAGLEPPPRAGTDLAAQWAALADWARAKVPEVDAELRAAQHARDEAAERHTSAVATLERSCSECGLDLSAGDIAGATVAALTQATAEVGRIQTGIADAEKLRAEIAVDTATHSVAGALAQHLSAKGFERWMVNEALRRLVLGATEILQELSGGQYSLTIDDDGSFQVTDHHNANEMRSAKTLSGGETFLASLSLALALSDHLVELAAEGAARLEAIFLDEGFGTLDAETLDTVAATVENLAAKGRMVGIITHVRELADRVPLQFRVKKEARSSSIQKVSA
ncbi:MAG: AAA family ATPase [Actinomycetota bacterium]